MSNTVYLRSSRVAQLLKNPPAMQETWVWSLCQEDPLEEEMATLSSIFFAWRIPMDRGAWQATVYGVAKSQTQPRDLAHTHIHTHCILNIFFFSSNIHSMVKHVIAFPKSNFICLSLGRIFAGLCHMFVSLWYYYLWIFLFLLFLVSIAFLTLELVRMCKIKAKID